MTEKHYEVRKAEALERIAVAFERIAGALEAKLKPEPWWNANHTGAPSGHDHDYDVLTGDSGC